MSSAGVSTSAALGRPFVFDEEAEAGACPLPGAKKPAGSQEPLIHRVHSTIKNQSAMPVVTPASRLEARPAPEMASSGIAELDALTGGLPRGCLTEICGSASSGRTTLLLAALAAATRRGEFCVVVDASDALDPQSAAAAGVELERLLWVRCGEDSPRSSPQRHRATENLFPSSPGEQAQSRTRHQNEHRLEQVLRATDLLLESGGFGMIVLDLGDLPAQAARHIPLTTWFRFRRAVENKPTILLSIEQRPIAGSCSSLLLQLEVPCSQLSVLSFRNSASTAVQDSTPAHTQLLTGMEITAELLRSRLSGAQPAENSSSLKTNPDRKPAGSVSTSFASKTSWGS